MSPGRGKAACDILSWARGDSYASRKSCKIKWLKRCSVLSFLRVASASVSYHLFRGLKLLVWHAGRWVLVLYTSSTWWTSRSGSWFVIYSWPSWIWLTSVFIPQLNLSQRSGFFSFPCFRVTSVVFVFLPLCCTRYFFPTLDKSRYLFHSDLNICVCCVLPL